MSEPFSFCWFETRTGTRYEMHDMTTGHVDTVCRQLDGSAEVITVGNISNVIMILPKLILARAGVGSRCFWEASCGNLNPPGPYQKD